MALLKMVGFFILFGTLVVAADNEWPALYNSDYSSSSPSTILRPPLKLKWVTRVFECFKSGPVVAEGKVVCQGRTGALFCLDAETGELLWRFSIKKAAVPQPWASAPNPYVYFLAPCINQGRVYVSFFWTNFPEVSGMYCLDLKTGRELWRRSSGFIPIRGRFSPIVRNGRLFYLSNVQISGNIYRPIVQAWDAITGDSLWQYQVLDTVARVLFISADSGTLYASAAMQVAGKWIGKTVALNGNGEPVWPSPNTQSFVCDSNTTDGRCGMVPTDGQLFILRDASVDMLNPDDGTLIRSDASPGYQMPALWGNRYWRRTYGGSPKGYNINTGQLELSCDRTASVTGCSTPTAGNGFIYLGHGVPGNHSALGHVLRAYDAVTGKVAWSFRMSSNVCTEPAIAYDKLYVTAGGNGDLVYCFENSQ